MRICMIDIYVASRLEEVKIVMIVEVSPRECVAQKKLISEINKGKTVLFNFTS